MCVVVGAPRGAWRGRAGWRGANFCDPSLGKDHKSWGAHPPLPLTPNSAFPVYPLPPHTRRHHADRRRLPRPGASMEGEGLAPGNGVRSWPGGGRARGGGGGKAKRKNEKNARFALDSPRAAGPRGSCPPNPTRALCHAEAVPFTGRERGRPRGGNPAHRAGPAWGCRAFVDNPTRPACPPPAGRDPPLSPALSHLPLFSLSSPLVSLSLSLSRS